MKGSNRGGTRQGAGRKAGVGSVVATSPNVEIEPSELPLEYHSICLLEAMGWPERQIEKLDRMPHRSTIARWRSSDPVAWEHTVRYYQHLLASDPLRAAKPIAHSTIIRAAAAGNITAARDILDRVDGKAIIRQHRLEDKELHITIEDITREA